MTSYKHGVYSETTPSSVDSGSINLGTVPVYIGTLPIQRLNKNGSSNFNYAPYINKPILIKSYNDIVNLGVQSSDWQNYTLCEAIDAHFLNGNEVLAPIILINILDPKKTVKTEAVTQAVELITDGESKVGYINDPLCTLDDIAFAVQEGTPTIGEGDYTVEYEGEKVKVTITKVGMESVNSVNATYKQIELSDTTITPEKFNDALKALDYCELVTGYIPNIVASPKFSKNHKIHANIIAKVTGLISEKWRLIAVSDIPCDSSVNTIELAKQWKTQNGYNSKFDKVCYPMALYGSNKYHLSTVAVATMMSMDRANDDVPFVSPSNKAVNVDAAILEDGTQLFMTESEANSLNEVGITTLNIIRRRLRLWGSHMANYDYSNLSTISYEDRSDSSVRMMIYLLNYLQYNFVDSVDTPFTRKDIDSIITSVQQWLNSLVNENKLLYGTISFNESENATDSMIDGDFVFDVANTLVPNAKSITFKVNYSKNGLSLLTSGGEA